MAEPDLSKVHDLLVSVAEKAGRMITTANPATVDTKKNSSDLVTETDKAVEKMVFETLREEYPSYTCLGEESSADAASSRLTDAPSFIVDPIDGTTNFVHSFPYVSISLAFAIKRQPLVGVVYNPFTQHLYSAIHGKGAYVTAPSISPLTPLRAHLSQEDGQLEQRERTVFEKRKLPIRNPAPPLTGLSGALVAVEWGNERSGNNWECKTKTFDSLAGDKSNGGAMVQSLRSLGSAALNLSAVAAGYLDCYWEGGFWAWDLAAGYVILKEAGGILVGANPGVHGIAIDERNVLAVRAGEGGQELVEEFWSHVQGKLVYDL